MITARMTAGRKIAASIALATLAIGVTSCGAVNQQSTTDHYAPSDGIIADVADVKLRNLMLITNAEHQEARLIGTIVNDANSSQTVGIEAGDADAIKIRVGSSSALKLEDEEFSVDGLAVAPGEHAQTTITAGGETKELTVPVLDGTLEEYRQFVPGGYDDSTTDHLTPSEPAAGGGH